MSQLQIDLESAHQFAKELMGRTISKMTRRMKPETEQRTRDEFRRLEHLLRTLSEAKATVARGTPSV